MLTTHLNTFPYTKFILIEDTVASKGYPILDYLIRSHVKKQNVKVHFFIFESNFKRALKKHSGIICHDCSSDPRNWFSDELAQENVFRNINENCVVLVDSLVHVCYRYGIQKAYQIFNELKNQNNVQQIIATLHCDMLENAKPFILYFEHLATLYMDLDVNRVSYILKKSQRKVIKQLEEYYFDENGKLVSQEIKKPDKATIEEAVQQINPENISTFKIGLSEKDKELRDNLVLPYLPKEESTEPKIHYSFDDIDDWDEEDPDDDLDI